MSLIRNGEIVSPDKNILLEKWKLESVEGTVKADKPPFCIFNNVVLALQMLNRHIILNSKMALHTDVDVDGIGTTYILKKVLTNLGSNNHLCIINKDKVHGIQQKHVEYFNNKNKIELLIVTDSSSNEIDLIKQFNCDVLVIDHHDLLHNDLSGTCNDGIHHYVIVNNTIKNNNSESDKLWLRAKDPVTFKELPDWLGDSDMSCGLVIYELLRLYCVCFANPKLLENLLLFQWVGVTLITDVINTLNNRNQWYMDKTVFNMEMEPTLRIMMQNITSFKASLDKSYIGYTFAPLINKAIRAGQSSKALDIVINHPQDVNQLKEYAPMQAEAVDRALLVRIKDPVTGIESVGHRTFNSGSAIMDISSLGINGNYAGVIASRISGDFNCNAAVYTVLDNGLCKGSFRGRRNDVDYRKYFANFSDDIYAQGHPPAFGFELTYNQLKTIMDNIVSIEPTENKKPWLTIGNMLPSEYGEYHIDSLDDFKRQAYIWRIATGNSKVVTNDEINIRVKVNDVKFKENKGKLMIYDVLGMECKSFKPLEGEFFNIYMEYTNEIVMYIK